jgi:hypothetical protein
MPSKVKTLLLVIGLSFASSLANESPKVGRLGSTGIDNSSPAYADNSNSHAAQLTAYGNTEFSRLCADFVKPHIVSDRAEVLHALKLKSLPAVPGATFLPLTGFFCVSLARDRTFCLVMKSNYAFVKGVNG